MATYYVSASTGNNTNNGLSPSAPWATLAFALGAASGTNPGVVGGDIIYVAPGNYNEAVTIGLTSPSSTVQILGDPLNLQGFVNVAPGIVNWFNSSRPLTATSKNNITFKNFYFENRGNDVSVSATNCYSWTYEKCVFASRISHTVGQSVSLSLTINKCIFGIGILNRSVVITGASGANYNINTVINNCISVAPLGFLEMSGNVGGVTVYNCTAFANDQVFRNLSTNTTDKLIIKNTFMSAGSNNAVFAVTTFTTILDFCHRYGNTINTTETNTITTLNYGIDFGYSRLTGFGINDFFAPYANSVNEASGTATGAPATDIYGVTWLGNPDIGAPQRSSSLNFQQQANMVERNASTITIAPGETSQSIELYLGATGLTASTSGLSARYNRTRTASVSIPLVARTIAQAWTAGGFAEVDATNMPGVYRLDVPDAALAAGADDVTIVVRGASGTNGAVMTVKLSSGGLTSAQTAAAVWDEARSSHVTAGTFGQYVNAELVTPVTSAALVRMGPYEVKADGLGASDPLDIQKGAQHGVDIQCVDAFGSGIDITSATVTAKVYNSGATLVDTYACTATYAADGRATFTIDTTVTDTPGTYTATITRTTGASDTQVFGPLRIYVRDI